MRIFLTLKLAAATLLIVFSHMVMAQTGYPEQAIKLVVPFGPGGSTDLAARLIAEYAGRELGQSIIVENRAGAGGSVGMEYVAKSKPDGYTLGMATMSTHGANLAVYGNKLKYDPIKDFAPITNVAATPSVFAVNPKIAVNNLQQFIALAQANPDNIRLLHVPYKGAGAAMNDVLAGQVDTITDNLPTALPHIKAGRLRALAVLSDKRSPALPDVPTYGELGFPQMGSGGWFGIVAPAGTPPSVITKLNKAILQAMKNPELIKKLDESGAVAIPGTPAEFAAQIQQAIDRYQRIAKIAKIQID